MFLNRKRVVCSGNAIRKSTLMQKIIERAFELPIDLSFAKEEAAQGAAKLASVA